MRRTLSLPSSAGKTRKPTGGKQQEEQKISLTKLLAPYKEWQTGEDLSSGGYKVGAHIAAGADGDVFRAIVPTARREVAVKRIRVTSGVIQRHTHQEVAAVFHARKMYAKEVNDMKCIGHPCIVGYLDWFAGPGGLDREVFIVMELCNFGIGDLIHTGNVMRTEYEKMVKSRTPLEQLKAVSKGKAVSTSSAIDPKLYRFPERELVKVLFQMLSALAFLNRNGIFHRDVKSENILWKHDHPNEGFYKLADFGVAFCEADADPAKRHDDCGTLWIMAPELLGRRPGAGPSCDTWSLAVVLFEMAFYEKPFNSLELLAYRNSGADSLDGFWNSLCGEKKNGPAGTSPAGRWGSNPSSPKNSTAGAGCGFGGRPARIVTKQASSTSLPSVTKPSFGESQPASPVSPMGRLGKALARRTNDLNASAPPPLSLSRPSSGVSRGRRGTEEEEEPSTPVTPASCSASPSDALKARKRAFFRKRSNLRWIYSEDLRSSIFEDMLDEDVAVRPNPAELLASAKVQGLLASYDICRWSTPDDVTRSSTLGVASSIRPESASGKVLAQDLAAASGDSCPSGDGSPATVLERGATPTLNGNALCRLTPEAFLAVLKTNRKFDAAVFSHENYEAECDAAVLTAARPAELS